MEEEIWMRVIGEVEMVGVVEEAEEVAEESVGEIGGGGVGGEDWRWGRRWRRWRRQRRSWQAADGLRGNPEGMNSWTPAEDRLKKHLHTFT